MSEVTTWSQQLLEKSKTKHWATHIFFGDEPPADLYLIWCIKSWILHILRGHTIQHWRLPDPKSSTVNKQHNSWTILRPNPTQLKTVKTKKFKKNFDRSLFQKLRKKKKEKENQPKKQDSARQSIIIIIKTTWKNYIRRKPRPVLPCDAPPPHAGLRCNNEMPVCMYSTRITSIYSLGMCAAALTARVVASGRSYGRAPWPTSPPATFCSITALPSIELFFSRPSPNSIVRMNFDFNLTRFNEFLKW